MTTLDTSPPDLELGRHHHRRRRSSSSSSEEGSQFYSTIDNQSIAYSSDIEKDSVLGSPKASSGVESDCAGMREKEEERECRICQMSLLGENGEEEDGIELGCCCKDDLGAAHKSCAEAWFKIKGNKTCEICNSIAKNVFSSNETESTQHINDPNIIITNAVPAQGPESRSCINGHRLVNFLLACMVFVFIISWLFHFNIHS